MSQNYSPHQFILSEFFHQVEIGLKKKKSIKKFVTDDIEISSDNFDEENSGKENYNEEN